MPAAGAPRLPFRGNHGLPPRQSHFVSAIQVQLCFRREFRAARQRRRRLDPCPSPCPSQRPASGSPFVQQAGLCYPHVRAVRCNLGTVMYCEYCAYLCARPLLSLRRGELRVLRERLFEDRIDCSESHPYPRRRRRRSVLWIELRECPYSVICPSPWLDDAYRDQGLSYPFRGNRTLSRANARALLARPRFRNIWR